MMTTNSIKIIQISDIHLFSDPTSSLLGVPTQLSFNEVLKSVKKFVAESDFILLSGDLSHDVSHASYQRLAQQCHEFKLPIYCIPGNHDEPAVLERMCANGYFSPLKQLIFKYWQVILLNSHLPGTAAGRLSIQEVNFLKNCLDKYPDHHALIVLHHHPVPVESSWLDQIGLLNADEFWSLLGRYPKVQIVLFGHIHQAFEKKIQDILCLGTPSTCIQFKPMQAQFALDDTPPGFRLLELKANGQIKTEVQRIDEYVGNFEAHAKGY